MPERIDELLIYTPAEFAALDFTGCPALCEQGRTVTRGFISGLEIDGETWTLHLRDVDRLDKSARRWTRAHAADIYTSTDGYYRREYSDASHTTPLHHVIGGHGMQVFIAPKMDDPWSTYAWADVLQTDTFEGGILGRDALPE